MKNRKKWILTSLLAVCIIAMYGCDKSTTTVNLPEGEISYPIESEETLTYWVGMPGALATVVDDFGETYFSKEYQEKTGIKVEYKHPAQGQADENLNLLIAAGDLPDIIEANWLARNPEECIEKKTITSLNELIDKHMPNLKKFLSENEDINKAIKTDNNNYYVAPFIRGSKDSKLLTNTSGFIMRKDWLEKLGMDNPKTIEDWEKALIGFRDEMGAKEPLIISTNEMTHIAGAFGAPYGFYVENSEIKYGPVQSGFKEFLITMNRWYKDGLIDKNFAVLDDKIKKSKMLSGESGASFGSGGSHIGTYLDAMKGKDYDVTAVQYPVISEGDIPKFTNETQQYTPGGSAAITGKCKNKELAARFLDYSYSEEGHMLNNFGIEGESYDVKDGYPAYSERVTKNPEGLTFIQALNMYVRAVNVGPFVQDERYIEQYYALDRQKEALEIWSKSDAEVYRIPQITLTGEESSEYSKIMSDIDVYRDENIIKFIIGERSIEEFDKFVSDIDNMKIARAIELQQNAYDRFVSRK